MTILIVRDRASSGGGIYNYYTAVVPHMKASVAVCDAGKPYSFYGDHRSFGSWLLEFTPTRLLMDWFSLAFNIIRHRPGVLVVNPSMDPSTYRSLKRDAVNILIGRLLGRRVLSFWRGWENDCCDQPEFPGGNKSLLCRIYKMAHAHIVLSERFKEDLLRWGFKTPIHVETTVVGQEFLSAPANKTRVPTNLLYLSRIEIAKGMFEMLEAYQIIKARNPAYTLTIAGDGPDLQTIREHVKNSGLRDVTFTGFVSGGQKITCYRNGGIFCFLSYTEGMPNAVLEALAMGLPVVSSDAGGLRDILRHGEHGFVVPPLKDAPPRKKFDPLAVAHAIEQLAANPELFRRISELNHQYARERFAVPEVAKRLEAICQSVFANEPMPAGTHSESVSPVCVE